MNVCLHVDGVLHSNQLWPCVPREGENVFIENCERRDGSRYSGLLPVQRVDWYPGRAELHFYTSR